MAAGMEVVARVEAAKGVVALVVVAVAVGRRATAAGNMQAQTHTQSSGRPTPSSEWNPGSL